MKLTLRALAALAFAGALFAADPVAGTWTLNTSKSKPALGLAFPAAATAMIVAQGDIYEISGTQVYADGRTVSAKITVPINGGPIANPEAVPGVSTSMKRADEYTLDFTTARDGKDVQTMRVAVSRDGRTMQRTVKGTDPQGKSFEVLEVYDRQ
jgi:hypothetical protein